MGNSSETAKIGGALLVGALVGASLGILFAPDNGAATREKLAGGFRNLAHDIQKKLSGEASILHSRADELLRTMDASLNGQSASK